VLQGYNKINAKINGKVYSLWVADNDEKRKRGLSGLSFLPENHGMIFIYDTPTRAAFTMRNVYFPLTMLFLDKDFRIAHQEFCQPGQKEKVIPENDFLYVIEI
jgi:uncharacterized protein